MDKNAANPVTGADYIQQLRSRYVNFGVKLFALLSVYVALISIMRSVNTGWLPIYNLQIIFALVLLGLYFFSRSLADGIKGLVLVGIAFAAGISGVLTFGLLGSGFFYFILAGLFLAIFFSRQLAYLAILAGSLVLVVVGYLHTEDLLSFSIEPAAYMKNLASWWTVVFGPFIVGGFLIFIIGDVRSKLVDTLLDLEESHKEIRRMAMHDTLTDLPNLRSLQVQFDAVTRNPRYQKEAVALLVLDLDGFKKVNDRYGHIEGDFVLKDIASRLKYCVGDSGFVARLCGDEFVVMLYAPVNQEQSIQETCNKLLRVIRHPTHMVNDDIVTVMCSVGAVLLCPAAGFTLDQALHEADRQMYQAKRQGGNRLMTSRLGLL